MTGPHDPTDPGDELDIRYEDSRVEAPGATGDDPALRALDARARAAATGLQSHVRTHVGAVVEPAPLAAPRRQLRSRVLTIAAVAALVVGFVATQDTDREGGRVDVDDSELPDLEPGLLTPLGPRDGKDSIRLPITFEPDAELRDGDTITVTGEGFVPGESVGIVQCAKEAGGDDPEQRGGADACNLGAYKGVAADADGVATGEFQVRRLLTTPLTGTVDCAAEAERCIIAMGAISDYDRSGGTALTFDAEVEPVPLPTVTVEPAEDLAHGQKVRVTAEGLTPNRAVSAQICSGDPSACWSTGTWVEMSTTDGYGDGSPYPELGLLVDGDGRIDGEVAVWRFLPGPQPGTYVDCAVSRCSLRLSGDTSPPTVPLSFRGDEPPPEAPAMGVEPSTDLVPGQSVIVAGSGFPAGTELWLEVCASPADLSSLEGFYCEPSDRTLRVEEDGTFATEWTIPDLPHLAGYETCDETGSCTTIDAGSSRCDGTTIRCHLNAQVMSFDGEPRLGEPAPPPLFGATAVPITFRQ